MKKQILRSAIREELNVEEKIDDTEIVPEGNRYSFKSDEHEEDEEEDLEEEIGELIDSCREHKYEEDEHTEIHTVRKVRNKNNDSSYIANKNVKDKQKKGGHAYFISITIKLLITLMIASFLIMLLGINLTENKKQILKDGVDQIKADMQDVISETEEIKVNLMDSLKDGVASTTHLRILEYDVEIKKNEPNKFVYKGKTSYDTFEIRDYKDIKKTTRKYPNTWYIVECDDMIKFELFTVMDRGIKYNVIGVPRCENGQQVMNIVVQDVIKERADKLYQN